MFVATHRKAHISVNKQIMMPTRMGEAKRTPKPDAEPPITRTQRWEADPYDEVRQTEGPQDVDFGWPVLGDCWAIAWRLFGVVRGGLGFWRSG